MAYLGKTPSQAVRSRFYFTASGGETSLAPAQVTGLSFTDANYVDVSLNGVALVSGTDYTATPSTNTISSLSALTASDVVEIVVYDVFSVFGGNVNGDFTISNGTLAAEAVTVTGLTTTGNINFGDNDKAQFGDGNDLQIYHTGGSSFVADVGTGNLTLLADEFRLNNSGNTENMITAAPDGAVTLFHNDSAKLATTSTGVDVTGVITTDGMTTSADINFGDNDKAIFGAGPDLEIYSDGTYSRIMETGGQFLVIDTNGSKISLTSDNSKVMADFIKDSAVQLRHNGSQKFSTTSTGCAITGGFTATDGCTITTADNSSQLTLISTDADGSSGPHLVLQRDSSSPADNDLLGQILFRGEDDGSNVVEACEMKVTARDVTNGTEDSQFDITTQVAGTARSRMVMNEVETTFNQDSQDLDFRVEGNGDANLLFVDAGNDRIGVGTSAPSQLIDATATGSTTSVILAQNTTSNDGAAHLRAKNPQNELIIGTDNHSGGLTGTANASFLYTGSTTPIVIMPNGSEKVRITSAGLVGIGESSPDTTLHIRGTSTTTYDATAVGGQDTTGTLKIENTSNDANVFAAIDFNTNNNRVVNRIVSGHGNTTGNGFLAFVTENSGTPAERLRITSGGSVGIGTTSPSVTFEAANASNPALSGVTNRNPIIQLTNTDTGYVAGNATAIDFATSLNYTNASIICRNDNAGSGFGGSLIFATSPTSGDSLTERLRINSSGNVGINNSSPAHKLHCHGAAEFTAYDNTSGGGGYHSSNGLLIGNAFDAGKGSSVTDDRNSIIWNERGLDIDFATSNTHRMKLTHDGNLLVTSGTIGGLGSYNNTTGSGANVHILSSGVLVRSTSSSRYKNTINDATHGLTELLALRPVTYKGNNDGDTIFGGLIAEEVHDAGLTEFVQYNDDNEPDSLAYGNMVSLCIKALQEQQATITALEARLTALENA
jgi:hypothetical protein